MNTPVQKRVLDLFGSVFGLVVLAPLIGAVAAIVRVKIGRPVLFRQVRPGRDAEPFELIKFRTMTQELGADGRLLPDEDRISSVGQRLRRWSLDELPELWNVARGDMSLVGPRPLLSDYLPLYTDEQSRRHDVSPGLTGLSQVLDRNNTTWARRLELDVWYVDHQTIDLDLRILLTTIAGVLTGRGVAQPGHATMPRFQGSRTAHESDG